MFFRVNLDGCESVVEAGDTIDAIRVARELHAATDVKSQSAEQVSEDEEAFYQSEREAATMESITVEQAEKDLLDNKE